MHNHRRFYWLVLTCSSVMAAPTTPYPEVVAQVIVTNNCYYHHPSALTADDIIVTHQSKSLPIATLVPLRGLRTDLELYILVDSSSNWAPGNLLPDLRQFLTSQPPTTSIGVAYIQEGRLRIKQTPTPDRDGAFEALSAPSGSPPSNPFRPLAELIEGWHGKSFRRVVMMISDGIDPGAISGHQDTSVEAALQMAQRAGVTVYTIYHPGAGYLSLEYMAAYSGQVQLAHLAIETGGAAYFQGLGPSPSVSPFLANIADRLANQYLLQFVMNGKNSGTLQDISVTSKSPDSYLSVPWKVWVPRSPTLESKRATWTACGRPSAAVNSLTILSLPGYATPGCLQQQ